MGIPIRLHTLIPMLPNGAAVFIAVGMFGATVMPYVIYLHSQLVQCRRTVSSDEEKKTSAYGKIDINIVMNIAFIFNDAMVIIATAVFYKNRIQVDTIEQAQKSLQPLLGTLSSNAFGIALLPQFFPHQQLELWQDKQS